MKLIDPLSDPWQAAPAEVQAPAPRAHALLSLGQWHAVRDHWPVDLPVGVALANTDAVGELAADLHRLALVTLEFPKWTDGRAYSQARLLRGRLRYVGELRATGQVVIDMLPLLQRTGFDAAALRGDQRRDLAGRALFGQALFPGHYQFQPQLQPA